MQVQHPDTGDAGRLGQVGVEGEQRGVLVDGQPHQLGVDLGDAGDGVVEDDDLDAGLALERLEHLETATSLAPSEVVTGVGEALQLSDHRGRQQDLTVQEAGPDDVDDPAVDGHRGVDDLGVGGGSDDGGAIPALAPNMPIIESRLDAPTRKPSKPSTTTTKPKIGIDSAGVPTKNIGQATATPRKTPTMPPKTPPTMVSAETERSAPRCGRQPRRCCARRCRRWRSR